MKQTQFDAKGNTLTVTRIFDADVELVWRAWTEAELLDLWWAPEPWKSKTKEMSFEPNGKRLYAMIGPEGEEHWGLTIYLDINKHQIFTGKDVFCDSEGNINKDLPEASFENHFQDNNGSTTVTIITEYASEEQLKQIIQMGMKEGLSLAFEGLDKVVENLK